MTLHSITLAMGFYIFWGENWFTNPLLLGCKFPVHVEYPILFKLYYMCQCHHYVYENIRMVFIWMVYGKEKDFLEMAIHHNLSLALILQSYLARYAEFGVVVLFPLNISHVIFYISRMSNDVKAKKLLIFTLPLALIFWLVCRQVVFPYFVIAPFWGGVTKYTSSHDAVNALTCCVMLSLLYFLNAYFGYKIFYAVVNMLYKGHNAKLDVVAYKEKEK